MKGRLLVVIVLFSSLVASLADWPGWLGSGYTGASLGVGFPVYWSKTDGVAWKVDFLPGAVSTPIVWQDQVFIATRGNGGEKTEILSFDRRRGLVRWRQPLTDKTSTVVSIVTDGERLAVYLGNGELQVFSCDGARLWKKTLQAEPIPTVDVASLQSRCVISDGKIFVQFPVALHGRDSNRTLNQTSGWRLMALSLQDGKLAWQSELADDGKPAEIGKHALVPVTGEAGKQLLVTSGDRVSGFQCENGKELWHASAVSLLGKPAGGAVDTALFGDGTVVVQAREGSEMALARISRDGRETVLKKIWQTQKVSDQLRSHPLLMGSGLFVISDTEKTLQKIDVLTGGRKWSAKLPSGDWSETAVLGADGKIFCLEGLGEVVVVDGSGGRILSRTPMNDLKTKAGISGLALSHSQLFVSNGSKLYCVEGAQVTVQVASPGTGERIGQPEKVRRRLPL